MISRGRTRRLVGAAALLALWSALSATAPVAPLDVTVGALRSTKGLLRVCLTADPKNFPNCVDDRDAVTRSVPAAQHLLRFDALPAGDYAVAVIHDANGNGKLDTFAGIPREGFGFSRDPAIGFGPPRFAAARFTLTGVAETQRITIRYIL